MSEARLEQKGAPRGLLRLLFRAPIWLYRARLGFLLGRRFLMLEHRGRVSGRIRRTVLEVVSATDTAVYVAAAWGEKAQWLHNIRAHPHLLVHWGSRRFETTAGEIDTDDAASVLADYADRHPGAFRRLASLILTVPSDAPSINVTRLAEAIPVVELRLPPS